MDTVADVAGRIHAGHDDVRYAARSLGLKRDGQWAFDEKQVEMILRFLRKRTEETSHDEHSRTQSSPFEAGRVEAHGVREKVQNGPRSSRIERRNNAHGT